MQKLLKLFEPISKYLAAAILIIIPLYPKFPFLRIPGIYVAIRLEDFLLAVIGIISFVSLLPKIRSLFKDGIVRSMFLFIVIGVLSLAAGVFLTQTADFAIGLLHLLRRVEYFVPFLFAYSMLFSGDKVNVEYFIKLTAITVIIVFIYGLGQRYFNFPVIITQNEEYSKGTALFWTAGSHISSTFAGHYDMASYLVLVLPVFISLFFVYSGLKSKIFLGLSTLAGFWLLINSLSRVSFFSYIIAVSISLFLMKKYKAIAIIVLASIILSAFSPSLFERYKRVFEVLYRKIAVIVEVNAQETVLYQRTGSEVATPAPIPVFEDRSSSIRFNVEWPRAVRSFLKNPLLGTGYSSLGLATDNDYLRLLGEVGILGFLSFGLIFLNIGITLLKAFPLSKHFSGTELGFIAGIIGGAAGTLVNAVFIDVFEASKFAIIFWFMMGLSMVLVRRGVKTGLN